MHTLTRREFMNAGAAALAAACLPHHLLAAEAGKGRRNVLFIAVDDLRPQLGCYGVPFIKTPHIDKLAAHGMVFEHAYCQQAVCAPSRASVMTGMRPDSTRVWDLTTPLNKTCPDVMTLPLLFRRNGYETVSLGKIYHHYLNDDNRGWTKQLFSSKAPQYHSPEGIAALQAAKPLAEKKREAMAKAVSVSERAKIDLSAEYRHPMPFTDCADVPDNAYPDGDIADKAIAHLQVLKDKPFFFAVGFLKPHLPFAAPKKYWDMYTRSQCAPSAVKDWPKGMPPIAGSNWGELLGYANGAKANEPDVARQLIHGYCAATSYVDAQIGRVIDELDRLGLRGNTVIILWGDHGWKLGEYGAWCKHTNFELDAHAPLILDAPGCTQGRRTQALVEFVDMYPTLADLCGLPVPAACEGTSMVPLLNDPKRAWKAAAFSQYPRKGDQVMGYTMRTKDWRYTEWIDRKTRQVVARELYDHRLPGMELVNLADDPTHAGTVTKLSAQLAGGSGWKAVAKGVN